MRSNSNTSRVTAALPSRVARCGPRRRCSTTSTTIGIAENPEILDPQNAGLFSRALAVEIDLEPHAPALHVGIEADELQRLAGVGRVGQQPALARAPLAQQHRERLAAVERALGVERRQLFARASRASSSSRAATCPNGRSRYRSSAVEIDAGAGPQRLDLRRSADWPSENSDRNRSRPSNVEPGP